MMILKRIGVCIVGFIFGIIITILMTLLIARINGPSGYVGSTVLSPGDILQGIDGYNAQFVQHTGIRTRSIVAQGLIDKINMVNMDEDNKLINGEKNIIYVSSKGTTKKVISEESYLEQSIERNKIYLADDLLELRALITPKDRVYDISIVDYYEDGCIKEMLIEAKEK